MPIYHKLGKTPHKRHTTFKKPDGGYYYEQLFGTIGFDGMSSLMYHLRRPTTVKEFGESIDTTPRLSVERNITPRKLKGFNVQPADDYLESRTPLFVNHDALIGVAAPLASQKDYFYKNADSDEMLFIHEGSGVLHTLLGKLAFEEGDYLIIPRGIIYQVEFTDDNNRILYVESRDPIYIPGKYRNNFGQLLEHSPFCERDIKRPDELEVHDEEGEFPIKIKKQNMLHTVVYDHHPFDVVGYDGYNYPYGFSIHDFEPITGRIHQPPPVHTTFETSSLVICSFCPRLYDYHPEAIPAPYNHSNIDSEEILYYVDGDFMSRNDIDRGYMTLHPGGIPHGPHPGAMERSIGKKGTEELAVMVDTFRPLALTEQAAAIEDGNYYRSWLDH